MRVDMIPIVVGELGMVPKDLDERLEESEIRGNRDHPHYSIAKISLNSEKSSGDLGTLYPKDSREKPTY